MEHSASTSETTIAGPWTTRTLQQESTASPTQDEVDNDLYSAIFQNDLNKVTELLNGTPTPRLDSKHQKYGETALSFAANISNLAIVTELVKAGASIYFRDMYGNTPLHRSASGGSLDIVEYLLDKAGKKEEYSALQKTAELAEILIDAGADWKLLNDDGGTPAMLASANDDNSRVLKFFLEKTPMGVNYVGDTGNKQTCLHVAASFDAVNNVEYLLRKGADPKLKDNNEQTAWALACKNNAVAAMSGFIDWEIRAQIRYETGFDDENPSRIDTEDYPKLKSGPNPKCFLERLIRAPPKSREDIIRHVTFWCENQEPVVDRIDPDNPLNIPGPFYARKFENIREPSKPSQRSCGMTLTCEGVCMPYFYTEPYENLQRRSDLQKKLSQKWEYCCSAAPTPLTAAYLPLTLDEYCKPILGHADLSERNEDQVLVWYRKQQAAKEKQETTTEDQQVAKQSQQPKRRERKLPDPEHASRLLVVHHAWLWKTPGIIFKSFPEVSKGTDSITAEVPGLLYEMVDLLDRPVSTRFPEPILTTFEKAIIITSDKVTKYVRSHEVEDLSLDQEMGYFHEIGDIREELAMIRSVVLKQEEVWRQFVEERWPEHMKDGHFQPPSKKLPREAGTQLRLAEFKRRIDQLDEDAQRVEGSISIRLDLKAKHASMKEAHATAVMSAAVFGFTVITIIFTPLSFMLSLFALPIRQFQDHQVESRWDNDSGAYTTNYIGKWMATGELVSVFVTIVFMWAAIAFGLHQASDRVKSTWADMKSTRLWQDITSTTHAITKMRQWISRSSSSQSKKEDHRSEGGELDTSTGTEKNETIAAVSGDRGMSQPANSEAEAQTADTEAQTADTEAQTADTEAQTADTEAQTADTETQTADTLTPSGTHLSSSSRRRRLPDLEQGEEPAGGN